MQQHLFTFPVSGRKSVFYASQKASADPSSFFLLSAGNYLMTERLPANGSYRSIALRFDPSLLQEFFLKYPNLFSPCIETGPLEPFLHFERDLFLHQFIASLDVLLAQGTVSPEMKQLKWEELMLYLCQHFPSRMYALRGFVSVGQEEFELRKTVENHLEEPISIEELAFLCHMSLSTFKRKFAKLYGTSPNKWMLHKRMERAAYLLKHHKEKPSEVFHKVGYENFSSFIQSFKQTYGMTPKEYQSQSLDVLQ